MCCSAAVLQCYHAAILMSCSATMLQCYYAAVLLICIATVLQCYFAAVLWCCSSMVLQCYDTSILWCCSVMLLHTTTSDRPAACQATQHQMMLHQIRHLVKTHWYTDSIIWSNITYSWYFNQTIILFIFISFKRFDLKELVRWICVLDFGFKKSVKC